MIRCVLKNGNTLFLPDGKVNFVASTADQGMTVNYIKADGDVTSVQVKQFEIIEAGRAYK